MTSEFGNKQAVYKKYFSLNYLGNDISNKFALISLVCHLTRLIRKKKSSWTYLQTIQLLNKKCISSEQEESLAIICEDFAYGCTEFITFGLKDADVPSKIQELLTMHIPF